MLQAYTLMDLREKINSKIAVYTIVSFRLIDYFEAPFTLLFKGLKQVDQIILNCDPHLIEILI